MQIEQVLSLESKVRDLQLQNRQLQGENLRLCLQLRQQEDTFSQHLQAYRDSQELVEKLQDEVSLSTSPLTPSSSLSSPSPSSSSFPSSSLSSPSVLFLR